MLNLDQLASFLAIARLGSFRLAARDRGVSQAAVSQHMRKLEALLGVRLVERDPGGCRLTVEGNLFVDDARQVLRAAHEASDRFRHRRVSVGAASNIGIYSLRPLLQRYAALEQGIDIDIRIGANPQVAEWLADGEVDVAVMEWWDGRPGYVARHWRDEAMRVIVAPGHPWARRVRIDRSDLISVRLLGGEPGTGTGRLLADFLGIPGTELPVAQRLGSTDAVKQWVKAGMGISLVLASVVEDEVKAGTLVALPVGEAPPKPLFAVWRDSLAQNHAASRFGDWLSRQKYPAGA